MEVCKGQRLQKPPLTDSQHAPMPLSSTIGKSGVFSKHTLEELARSWVCCPRPWQLSFQPETGNMFQGHGSELTLQQFYGSIWVEVPLVKPVDLLSLFKMSRVGEWLVVKSTYCSRLVARLQKDPMTLASMSTHSLMHVPQHRQSAHIKNANIHDSIVAMQWDSNCSHLSLASWKW